MPLSGKEKALRRVSPQGFYKLAPAVGLEPTTKWLTATYSTIELRRNGLVKGARYQGGHFCQSQYP
jgi:hypothetical protein